MPVLISNFLPVAVSRLNATDAKRVWDFLAKFMVNPAQPGISLERIHNAKDKKLWSGRISQSLRAVIHQDGETWTILYASNHDDAYSWASTKQLERHPATGALQIVESPEVVVEQVTVTNTVAPGLFDPHTDDYLLSLGIPPSWLPTIRKIQSEDVLLDILEKLPEEVAERLLNLAAGELVTPPAPIAKNQPVMKSKDTKRRFFVLEDNADILRMLEAPLATWVVFLHPSQRKLATGTFNGAVKITGSAGTGKTVVALHRARHLSRQGKRVLLTSFVGTICQNLERNLKILCTPEELAGITITNVHSLAMKLVNLAGKEIRPVDDTEIQKLLEQCYQSGCPLNLNLLFDEWRSIIQAQGIATWNEYRAANRSGRGYALNAKDRQKVWQVFELVLTTLQSRGEIDWSGLCRMARELVCSGQVVSSFDAVIVDEVQDLKPQEMLLLKALAGNSADSLTLVGDGGQRIFAGGFSLNALGIDVRGRSHTLRINYRTTEQIRNFADRILGDRSDDLDGNQEKRRGTVSLLQGPEPIFKGFSTQRQQSEFVVERIKKILDEGIVELDEIAIFARTNSLLDPIAQSLTVSNIPYYRLDSKEEPESLAVNIGTMHRAKGLEFKVIFITSVSDERVPLSYALKKVADPQALAAEIAREQQLLYVSVTRARDEVFLCWVGKPSRFIANVLNNHRKER